MSASPEGLSFRPYEPEDLEGIAALVLRESDQAELVAATGLSPREALLKSVENSKYTWVLTYQGQIEGAFGLVEGYSRKKRTYYGIPWLLATEKVDEFSLSFAKQSKHSMKDLFNKYPYLQNYVDVRNKQSIRWLKWLGFTVDELNPTYLHDPKVLFYKFTMYPGR